MLQAVKKKTFEISREERKEDGLYLYTQKGIIRVAPWSDTIIGISYTKKEEFSASYGVGVEAKPDFRQWHFISTNTCIHVLTKNVEVQIERVSKRLTLIGQ